MSSAARRVTLRLPAADARRLERLERGLDRSASAVLRLGLAQLDDAAPADWDTPPELRARLDSLAHAVDRVGVNINQAVRLAHIDGLDTDHLTAIHTEASELVTELQQGVLCPCQL